MFWSGCDSAVDTLPVPVRSPAEEWDTFHLAPGLRIELVAAEPMVEEPVVIQFDEDGRLWVVEMRGFMPNIEGEGEDEPVGRVVVLEDEDSDGVMDSRTVFLDSLVLPRAMGFVPGGVLIAESKPLWFVMDQDGDLKADERILVDSTYGGSGLPEHSPNGLWRGMDNWYYNAKSHFRYRPTQDGWLRDSTEFRGQWGISHDDSGRLYYNYNWSQLHADVVPPNSLMRNPHHRATSGIDVGLTTDMRVFPARSTPAVNRGYIEGALDEQDRLLEFTSASAPLVYRGTALPEEFYGNVFVVEPAGNLIKRNIVIKEGLSLSSLYAYPDFEFVASTDERFRPVNLTTGPEGALYIADMYRGIIQHGAYMTPYLKEQTLKRGLDHGIHLGRIWRIVPEEGVTTPSIRLSEASSAQLVEYLSHPDGWYRDTAQRLLVERNDLEMPSALESLVRSGASHLGRLHALWVMEGLGVSDAAPFLDALDDPHPEARSAAVRILEPIARRKAAVRQELAQIFWSRWENEPVEVVMHIALTAAALEDEDALLLLTSILERYCEEAVMRDAVMSSLYNLESSMLDLLWASSAFQEESPSRSVVFELLSAAILQKGDKDEVVGLLALIDSEEVGWREEAVMTGMAVMAPRFTETPFQLASMPSLFQRSEIEDESRIADLVPMFSWPGKPVIVHSDTQGTALDEQGRTLFAEGRQHYVSVCAGCHGNQGEGIRRFAPPLVDSEWVVGDEQRLIRIVLHGLEGPIDVAGRRYDVPDILPVMPPHSVMDDRELAAVLTYIRRAWGHTASPIEPRSVGYIRHRSQGQTEPWTQESLLNAKILEE